MSELNEKVGESQGHASEHRSTREIPQDELKKILETHKKWILSDRKVGERADLSRANLFGANLFGADLFGADLRGADLQGATLQGAKLRGATLRGADLQEAGLFGAKLRGADLFGADLRGADLRWAKLELATLRQADLRGADLGGARGLNAPQVKKAENWKLAFYSDDFLKQLGLPPDHNERVKKKLAELEKEKKATDAQ